MTMRDCNLNPHIQRYLDMILNGEVRACREQIALCKLVKAAFETEDIYTDDEQLENYLGLAKYFPYERLFEWEEFIEALHLCTYWEHNGMPRWPDLLCMVGRGSGKDGFIAHVSVALASEYNGIRSYDVDICANNEDQAMRPINDIVEAFEEPENYRKLKRFFYWTKQSVKSLKTKSYIKGHTNSPKGKDGLRSGAVILNEIHQYQNTANVNVFTTGLGKKKHPRRGFYTTNGNVSEGYLDSLLAKAERVLFNGEPDNGMLYFICKLDDKEEVHDKENWVKATPSLPYRLDLQLEIEKEYREWLENPAQLSDFMTKRMNIRSANKEIAVTDYENVRNTNKELPDLTGKSCICGIDLSLTTDWTAVNLHFRDGDIRYDICHTWVCKNSVDYPRLKCPIDAWAEMGKLTIVDDVEIDPNMIAAYILKMKRIYNIKMVCIDNFRYTIMSAALKSVGFDAKTRKNVKLVRPSDIMKVHPLINRCFINGFFVWGDNPPLRWAVNNTKSVRVVTRTNNMEPDIGNYLYGKIEPKSRKTDPFMSVVASMTEEEKLPVKYVEIPKTVNVRCHKY